MFEYILIGDILNIGDLVTRNSYNNDLVFTIIDIEQDIYYLKGINVRLYADSKLEDLKKYDSQEDIEYEQEYQERIRDLNDINRDEFFYIPGKILHIDGDKDYLNKCMEFYKKNRLKAFGVFSYEEDLSKTVDEGLKKYNPDILVITGHDAYYRKKRKDSSYKNTDNFIEAVKTARRYEHSHEKLVVIAGACQSNYEELIKAGANFASSPKRINIHALDPAIIASCLAFSDKNNNIDLIKILDKTKYGSDGIGGIITKGTMYIGYPR